MSKIDEIKQIAIFRNGICLSTEYKNNHSHLLFECKFGHQWFASTKAIKLGNWCKLCYYDKLKIIRRKPEKIKEIHVFAQKKGGKCLSDNYINNRSLLLFECVAKHKWETTWHTIYKGAWCPTCSKQRPIDPKGIYKHELGQIVIKNNGKCIEEYIGATTKIKFECQFKHTWYATPNSIKNGSWCPKCSSGFYERICKEYFEQIFEKEFIKIRPNWLKSSYGKNLELDGYCSELKLAFEHNGDQHYNLKNNFYSDNDSKFLRRQKHDRQKIKLCKKNNIKLIIIPELNTYVKIIDLKQFIKNECIKLNVPLPNNYDEISIDLTKAYSNYNFDKLKKLQEIAIYKDGLCISKEYISSSTKMNWYCNKCEFVWKATSSSILSGYWCHKCANKIPIIIDQMHQLALKRNGKCLSDKYINNHSKLTWQCNICNNIWNASYNAMQRGDWCPLCSIKRGAKIRTLNIDFYKEAAVKKGGKCLSIEYTGCFQQMEWECTDGHIWKAVANAIKNTNRWCPICANKLRGKKKVK